MQSHEVSIPSIRVNVFNHMSAIEVKAKKNVSIPSIRVNVFNKPRI
ncbi:hypothetical protein D1AOALGA4SA_11172 [Olavius algarvensis Delta 1 endosymbiont]|nr:hypothetical protein D1AOALGA4SA_11172 [Olavius algarvensis Delta 1 endosymbiont]